MKKCYICEKEISEDNGDLCRECAIFFKWKYPKRFKKILELHKVNTERSENDKIKFRRTK
jgi:hypothetical protein